MSKQLSHLDEFGAARMVDVGAKPVTYRMAIAKSQIRMSRNAAQQIKTGTVGKGEVLQIARIAGIQAAKLTSNLIPLCHVIPLEKVTLQAKWIGEDALEWTAEVAATSKTGVEMEALVAASTAALTVYDMCKSIDRSMEITHIALWKKSGGASGEYDRKNI